MSEPKPKIVIVGAGGHGKVVLDAAQSGESVDVVGFIDGGKAKGDLVRGVPVLGPEENLSGMTDLDGFIVGFGVTLENRRLCFERLSALGLKPTTVVHQTAILSPGTEIGIGTALFARVVVNADARIGSNVIVNTGAIIEHDCVVGDHSHIAPNATLTGGVKVGKGVLVGASAVILPGRNIADGAVIGAGAVVTRDVDKGQIVAGNPAETVR